mmetsp:Transcript_19642/g.75373  ORF Transcript_19642/g.75373 Transcript_19642/m.75373 type:complete len:123 (-) Transcript_19642:34-402(-)
MNAPEQHELFCLPEGVKKVTVEADTKVTNAANFHVQLEDHTLGNIIRMQLLRDPKVVFAGYKIPHPLENRLIVKVQTTEDSSPVDAMAGAIRDLHKELVSISEKFKREVFARRGPDAATYHQ